MFKFAAIISLILVGSTMWAASLSCDSCGSECASACGTRHFRSCCFNYLRKKRTTDTIQFTPQKGQMEMERPIDKNGQWKGLSKATKQKPIFVVENFPEQWMYNVIPSEYRPYDDIFENRFFEV